MKKMWMAGIFALSVSILTAYLFWPTDESRIRTLFKEGAKAVESGDFAGVMARVSYSYRDEYGMTYLSLREALKRQFQRLSDISVEYEHLRVHVHGDAATAELEMRVIATSGNETGYIIGDIRAPLRVRFTLDKERTGWLIVKAEGFEGPYGTRSPVR